MDRNSVEVILLGAAQDGGCPQCGCSCDNCNYARTDPRFAESPSSIAIISHSEKSFWVVDATPAFPTQLEIVKTMVKDYRFNGIFLTHAHIGHYTGLMYLGKEVLNTVEIPVFASSSICEFLKGNAPWSQLISERNIVLNSITEGQGVQVTSEISVTGMSVPHRDEFGDTLAFVVSGPTRKLFYCPDIDKWELWERELRTFLMDIDYALIDGTFFSDKELPKTRLSNVPHPTVQSSCRSLAGMGEKVTFIHMNHTNPLYREGVERKEVLELGFHIGKSGLRWGLSNRDNIPV